MEATADECIELAEALERRRALAIVATVKALGIGGADAAMPTEFHAGYQLACDEIANRIEHERWELVVPNASGKPTAANELNEGENT